MTRKSKRYRVMFVGFGEEDARAILEHISEKFDLPVDGLIEFYTESPYLAELTTRKEADEIVLQQGHLGVLCEILVESNDGSFVSEVSATRSVQRRHSPGRYAEVACDDCGIILPKNEMSAYSFEIETGRQGGSSRSSYGRSTRSSSVSGRNGAFSSGFSSGNSFSESRTSGRKYFKTVHAQICSNCLVDRQAQEAARIAQENSFEAVAGRTLGLFGKVIVRLFST